MHFKPSDKRRLYNEVTDGIRNGMVLVLLPEMYYPCKKSQKERRKITEELFLEYALEAPTITTF